MLATDTNGASLVDPLWAITCNDAAVHPGPVAAGDLARALAARYPLTDGYSSTYTMGGCVSWPSARQPVTDLHPTGTPPILVIGNTGDPNTPYASARLLASAIRGRLVTYIAYSHSWLLNGNTDACMQAVVGSYLAAGTLPAAGTRCGP